MRAAVGPDFPIIFRFSQWKQQDYTARLVQTPEELGALAVFFCSAAANNVRGVAWNMDGGWAAQ